MLDENDKIKTGPSLILLTPALLRNKYTFFRYVGTVFFQQEDEKKLLEPRSCEPLTEWNSQIDRIRGSPVNVTFLRSENAQEPSVVHFPGQFLPLHQSPIDTVSG